MQRVVEVGHAEQWASEHLEQLPPDNRYPSKHSVHKVVEVGHAAQPLSLHLEQLLPDNRYPAKHSLHVEEDVGHDIQCGSVHAKTVDTTKRKAINNQLIFIFL